MKNWKTLAFTALLFPAMAGAQMGPTGTPGTTGSPGMQDRPGQEQPGGAGVQPPGMQPGAAGTQPGMAPGAGERQPGVAARPGQERETLSSLEQNQFLADNLIGQPVHAREGADRPGTAPQPGMAARDADKGEKVGTVEDLILDQQGQVAGILINREAEGGKVALSWDVIDVQRDPQDRDSWVVFANIDQQRLEQAQEFDEDRQGAQQPQQRN
jgi:hypothetical protein